MYGLLSVRNGFVRSKDDETTKVALTSDDQIVAYDISSEIIKAPNDILISSLWEAYKIKQ